MSPMAPPAAYRNRLARQNGALFHFSANDGDVRFARTGQVGVFTRASADTVMSGTGTTDVAKGQPRWLSTASGAAVLVEPAGGGAGDVWTFPIDFAVQPMSIYVAGYLEQGGSGSGATRILRIGDGSAKTFDLISNLAGNDSAAEYLDGSGNPTATINTANPASGDFVEYLMQVDVTFKVTLTRTVNLGTPVVSATSAAGVALSGLFHGGVLAIGGGSSAAKFAYRSVLVVADS